MPFIYGMIVPSVIWDICLEIYHKVAFYLYGIEYVNREEYIKIDRHKLSKLNPIQKLNCVYCGYVNGLLAYSVQVAAETEKYWCGIKHENRDGFVQPQHHNDFHEYTEFK